MTFFAWYTMPQLHFFSPLLSHRTRECMNAEDCRLGTRLLLSYHRHGDFLVAHPATSPQNHDPGRTKSQNAITFHHSNFKYFDPSGFCAQLLPRNGQDVIVNSTEPAASPLASSGTQFRPRPRATAISQEISIDVYLKLIPIGLQYLRSCATSPLSAVNHQSMRSVSNKHK